MFASFNARAMGLSLSIPETLRLAHDHGFGGIDVMVRDALEQGEDIADVRTRMDDLGLQPGAFPLPFDWRGDDASFQDGLRTVASCAQAAERLGITRTGTWVLPEIPEHLGTRERTIAFHVERLGTIARILGDHGIRLGLEVIGVESSRSARGTPFLCRLDQLGPLIDALSPAEVGLVVDAWHLYAADEPRANALALGASQVLWVHVADLPAGAEPDRGAMVDSERGLPGDHGAIDVKALLRMLFDHGYDGPVTAEPLGKSPSLAGLSPDEAARKTIASLRREWPQLEG